MPISWGDEQRDVDQERWARGLRDTISEPGMTERDVQHQISLDEADRLEELGRIAYVDRPSDRERREHHDETRAQASARPHTGNVTVLPREVPCTCGAAARGMHLAGPAHRHHCPRYQPHVEKGEAA